MGAQPTMARARHALVETIPALMLSAMQPRAEVSLDPAQRIFALQREVLFRARAVIFTDLAELGGIPTWREECRQVAMSARAGAGITRSLGPTVLDAPFARVPPEQREYWRIRAPVILAFGARMHAQLTRLSARPVGDSRLLQASGLFQLTASLLDWIADEDGGGAEIKAWLPVAQFSRLDAEPAFRRALVVDSQREARATTAAFISLLSALVERLHEVPSDTTPAFECLRTAYDAELASFEPAPAPAQRSAIARAKSVAPTLVIGQLACLDVGEDDRERVWRVTTVVSPIFSAIDDLADLTSDLRAGHTNTICSAAAPVGDAELVGLVRSLIASGAIEELARDVAGAVRALDSLLRDSAVNARRRGDASRWLRTLIWQWLS